MDNNDLAKWLIRTGSRGKCGLRNVQGDLVFEQKYEWCHSACEYAYLENVDSLTIVDWKGNELRSMDGVNSISDISEGMIDVKNVETELEGYLGLDGRDIECKFRLAREFSNGVAAVGALIGKGKFAWGLINRNGEYLIEPRYSDLSSFGDESGVTPFSTFDEHGSWGLVDRNGKEVVPPVWESVRHSFREGRLVVLVQDRSDETKFGIVDPTGHWQIPPTWTAFSELINDGSVGAERDGLWGILDMDEQWIVEPKFKFCAAFFEGRARASILGSDGFLKTGFINRNGEWVIPAKYNDIFDFNHGLASVSIYNKKTDKFRSGYVDHNGREYWQE